MPDGGRGTAPSRKGPQKAKTARAHGYDARNYHLNAHSRVIQSLVRFDCPVCRTRNTVGVELDGRRREAVVRCGHCLSLRPRPAELPYPFVTAFVPGLENKADAFFRFSEAYRKLLQEAVGRATADTTGARSSPPPPPLNTTTSTNKEGLADAEAKETSSNGGNIKGDGGSLGGLFDVLEGILEGVPSRRTEIARDGGPESTQKLEETDEKEESFSKDLTSNKSGEEEEEELVDDVDAFFDD